MTAPSADGAPIRPASRMPLRRELGLWFLVGMALAAWWGAEWWVYGGSSGSGTAAAFRNYIATEMLVHDEYSEEGWHGPRWISWFLEFDSLPQEVNEAFESASQEGLTTDAMHADFALVSLRFTQDGGEDASRWKDASLAALARVSEAGRDTPYYRFVEKAVNGTPLTPKDHQDWMEYTQERNPDWWTGFLATQLQAKDTVDMATLQRAQTDALAGYVKAAVLIITLSILGLFALPAAWLTLARSRPATAFSNDRLFRLWQGPKVTGVFALSGLTAFGLNHFFSGDIYPFATTVLGNVADAYTAWWAGMWLWLGWAVAMVALPILPLCVSFAPAFSRLTRVFGFTGTDFATVRYLSFALVGMGLLPWGFEFLDAGLSYLGATSSILDGLSRSFSELGALSLPLSIFWGVILAPFVEEIIFRGFIFRAVQVRWGTAVGMVISSAVFAGTHFYSLNGTLHVFFYGLLFAWLYQRTGKLAASMIVHGAGNLALIFVAHFTGA